MHEITEKILALNTKQCTKCNIFRHIDEYYKNKRGNLHPWCKDCYKEYYKNNTPKIKKYQEEWAKLNKKSRSKYRKKRYQENKEKLTLSSKQYQEDHKEEYKEYAKHYQKKRHKENPTIRISHNISVLMRQSLKGKKNNKHWESIIGYTIKDLMTHLESKFQKDMVWKNYGKWHIDHIIPISLWEFETYTDREFKQCWALANLQPLWALDNIKKGNKIIN